MNLREFTDIVDKMAEELGREELQCFIHSIARKVPEAQREDFVHVFADVQSMDGKKDTPNGIWAAAKGVDEKEIGKESDRLGKLFAQIQDGKLYLLADGYEDYSEGYWNSDWVWEYEDPMGVCRIFEDACLLIQRCVNDGFYQEALNVFDEMMESEVYVENDSDQFSMGIEELKSEKLLTVNLNSLALEILYAEYQVSLPEMRAEELYEYFSIPFFRDVKLEQMLSLGREELKGLTEFWESWIELLRDKDGDMEARLLKEAVLCHKGEEGILDLARISYEKHPSLYLEAIQKMQRLHDYVRQLEIGKEALEKIDAGYILRSQIALSTAEAAILLQQEDYARRCWFEAFRSDSTPVNYLRLISQSGHPQPYLKETKSIILSGKKVGTGQGYKFDPYNAAAELHRNQISQIDAQILRFLSGDFEYAIELCRQIKQPLGWSGTFIKCGLALFLLLMYQGKDLQQGCRAQENTLICALNFNGDQYLKGTREQLQYGKGSESQQKTDEIFWQCFRRWKECHTLSEEQIQEYIGVLEPLIHKRLKAIVSGQHRDHYESVAALAAGIGEVKESIGMKGAKEKILQGYRQEFPRHSSFHAALRKYGMSDRRRG